MKVDLFDLGQRPDLWSLVNDSPNVAWPEFMMHDGVAAEHWFPYLKRYMRYSWAMITEDQRVAAGANAIPVLWDGTLDGLPGGWDAALAAGMALPDETDNSGRALCALGVTTHPDFQGQGLGKQLLGAMKARAREEGYRALISPMRPIAKHKHPRMSMEEYILRKDHEGKAEDPWLKTHLSLGAHILKVAPQSMRIEGSLADWKAWTGVDLVSDGDCEFPGGLVPVAVSLQEKRGLYVEPNVWILYDL